MVETISTIPSRKTGENRCNNNNNNNNNNNDSNEKFSLYGTSM